jgi:hypothetical protein
MAAVFVSTRGTCVDQLAAWPDEEERVPFLRTVLLR